VAVSLSGGSVVAFDAVCTHAGCQVSYDSGQRLLSCPCHGALFDPAHGAAVVAGPAPSPLASIPIQLGSDGGVYAD
jgi:thiosulfate dehydrogenase [quinone] large subunit